MATQIKGPAIFLAQFSGEDAPFNSLENITRWAAGLGYKGVQIPTLDSRLFDLEKVAESQAYCDEVNGICADAGLEITELSTHLQGQLVAVHPAYDLQLDALRTQGGPRQSRCAPNVGGGANEFGRRASRNLGLDV